MCWIMFGWIGSSLNIDSESGGNCWVLWSGWHVEKMCFLKKLLGSEGLDVGLCRTLLDRRWYFKIRVNICWTECRYLRWNFGFYSTKQVLPTCPPLPVGSNLLVSWSRCQRSEVRKGRGETPTSRWTGTELMEMLRKICGFHCDERLLFVSCLRGVAADGRVSSRWPLWCHTLWQAVRFERLVFPSLHFCFHNAVLALSSCQPLSTCELWCGVAT